MLVLVHQSKEQFMERFRNRYRESSGLETIRQSTWLIDRLDDGDFTDAQVMTSFNFKTSELVSFKARLNNWRSIFRQIRSAIGE